MDEPVVIKQSKGKSIYSFISWTPRRCRYDPANPPGFSMALNLLFAFAATITNANLYYNHPILNKMAEDFGVSDERISFVPALMQAGFATGLLFLLPLGDIFKRRAFTLVLVFVTATLWISLCLTKSLPLFCFFSFLTSVTTVTPQLMIPLVGSLATPHRRHMAISIVVSGLLLGILIARVLSGVVTQYTSWRNIYWIALGLQYLVFILLWLFMPNYPSMNPDGLSYFKLLRSILRFMIHEPLLIQACSVGALTLAIYTSFWTTLTFLLSSPPYRYSTLAIGLFAFVGIAGMCLGPVFARYVTNKFPPLYSIIFGELICLVGVALGTYTGKFTVAGPVIQAFAIDLGFQVSQTAQRSAIQEIAPTARNRINTAYMVTIACGQLMGTAAGNHLYAHGGWIRSGSASLGFVGASLVICLARGPWETGWVGWKGGWGRRRRANGGQADEEKRGEAPIPREDHSRADMSSKIDEDTVGENASGNAATESLQRGASVDEAL